MPRSARIDTPGVLHHVIIRGIERRKIFRGKADRQNFADRLSHLIPETQTICYAWVLMDNYAHFLFRSGPGGIVRLMRRLLTGYAVSFNRRYKRHGQLFQNRYKSIVLSILKQADQRLERAEELKRRGIDLEKIADKVARIYHILMNS